MIHETFERMKYETFLIKHFLDHCFYIFFICTDHVGSWPSNQNSCMDYYQKCADIVENAEFINTNAEYTNNSTTSTINDTFLGKFFVLYICLCYCFVNFGFQNHHAMIF